MLAFKKPDIWYDLLAQQGNPLAMVKAGGKVALLAKEELADERTEMILWERRPEGIGVANQPFRGFRGGDADIMLVVETDLLLDVCQRVTEDPIKKLRRGIREGAVISYFLRPKRELIDMGYEEFVESLGLPLQACQ